MSVVAAVASTRSLRLNREPPAQIDAVVLIGSTCTGKTTLANAVRAAGIPGIDVPRRFVTRAPRPGDSLEEATHLSSVELDAAIAAGMVHLHWSRTLEQGHVERYGFAPPKPALLPFYSANNAICQLALPNALIIGAIAPDDIRESRLRARSPELVRDRPAEARARLAEAADATVPFAHVLVDNAGELEGVAPAELVALTRHIAAQRA
jgi:ribose 1,5-bisphosphokinase PhnN